MMLAMSPIETPYAGLRLLRELVTQRSLSDFGWAIFEQWQAAGAPSKQDWGFTSLAHTGDDRVVHKLTPMIRRWPGESQHRRAVTGLDVLLSIGTDLALMNLSGIAQKVKFKGIKGRGE